MKLKDYVRNVEYTVISRSLERNRGFETKTAHELGISRGTLRTRLKEFNINRKFYKNLDKQ